MSALSGVPSFPRRLRAAGIRLPSPGPRRGKVPEGRMGVATYLYTPSTSITAEHSPSPQPNQASASSPKRRQSVCWTASRE
ncbi:hypothetical protein LBMAG42_12320 [Deltaproteobacteria bacterium]|nr:hypothetical protein LBMAG42_12320 [Deltaproteobacteria bacterium]